MTTPITRHVAGRARASQLPLAVAEFGRITCATTVATDPRTTAVITMNPWLGGDVQSKDFSSEHATKRTIPGFLEVMT